MKYLGKAICFAAVLMSTGAAESMGQGIDEAVIRGKNGENAVIVLQPDSTENTRYAARELQCILNKITGSEFRISEKETAGPKIYLDRSPGENNCGPEECAAATRNGNLYLYGHGKNGTLHAVYHFLQDEMG